MYANVQKLLLQLGFVPKENTNGVYTKNYAQHNNYSIDIDTLKGVIDYNSIVAENKTTQNFSQPENFVVLECVNRLLENGYTPESIILEKTYPSGHGTSGRLDILVEKEGKAFLMIECKTFGKEYDKELKNIQKSGGQLFTYFQQDKNAEILMLYASKENGENIQFKNGVVFVTEDLRNAPTVVELFNLWNKQTFSDHDFNDLTPTKKKFTKNDLKELTETEGNKLFNGFASILRKHSVSDKPNAFNVIFNLFLAKLQDEAKRQEDELEFFWREDDDPVDFQVRLYKLHKAGLEEFLKKEIEGIEDFNISSPEELKKAKKKFLKFNKLFDIKSVLDDTDFEQNHRVLKEVVQLIEKYQIRYPRKQRYLSDFFELLLTTGLKQEAGQYFTPPPITKFIVKSLPVKEMIEQTTNDKVAKLPAMLDYAVGSGHFITEILEEYQNIIDDLDTSQFCPNAKTEVETWKINKYSWAAKYIYGIEKDYRLVKVAKVGCYFYGDGLAQIIHGDGLDSLLEPKKNYVGLLSENTNLENSTKAKFSLVLSNPPYSVKNSKDDIEYIGSQNEFSLYLYLTDNSSEIECLFIERTKQLLKDGGIAGIILPSSILSNTGIYTKAREIILQYFEIVAITELGSNTFMATGTNTVVLFLKRRNNYDNINFRHSINTFFTNYQDVTVNVIEKPFSKYIAHVWEGIDFEDYITFVNQKPNDSILHHEIYKEYRKKIKAKNEKEFWDKVLEIEKEKLLYFVLTYPQQIVLVKSGEKDAEKRFLGYEFSNRRGSEGIHPIQRGKTIDECTQLFDANSFDNDTKASFYVYSAFKKEFPAINESLQKNISYINLVDALTFDRAHFEKTISTAIKKKVKIESKYPFVSIGDIANKLESGSRPTGGVGHILEGCLSLGGEHIDNTSGCLNLTNPKFVSEEFYQSANNGKLQKNDVLICKDGALTGKVAIVRNELENINAMINEHLFIVRCENVFTQKYLFHFLFFQEGQELLKQNITGTAQGGLNSTNLKNIKIPLPPLDIQQKIVSEIEAIEAKEKNAKEKIAELKGKIENIISSCKTNFTKLDDVLSLEYGNALPEQNRILGEFPVMGSNGIVGYHNTFLVESPAIIVGRKGSAGQIVWIDKNCFPIDTTFYVKLKDKNNSIKLIYYFLKQLNLEKISGGTGVPGLNRNEAYQKQIPLPSISEQQKIVAEIEVIETQIAELEQSSITYKAEKEAVLQKYL